jgi:pre-rRNA-processing protein TSR3
MIFCLIVQLESYSKCSSSEEVLEVQQKYLDTSKEEAEKGRDDFWPTSSSESDESEEDEIVVDDQQSSSKTE